MGSQARMIMLGSEKVIVELRDAATYCREPAAII